MPIFSYTAKDSQGCSVKSQAFASSEKDLAIRLARKSLFIISIEEKKKLSRRAVFFRQKLKTGDLVLFCKQLAMLLKGGVPIIRAIDSIMSELKDPFFCEVLDGISRRIKDGGSLSEGLRAFPGLFSPLFIAMAEVGEKMGSLEAMFERLSAYLQAKDRLNRKIITAVAYPSFIIVFFFIAMAIFTLFLIPRFKSIYQGFGAKLPLLTRAVFSVSDSISHNLLIFVVIAAAALFFAHKYFFKTVKGRYAFDRMALGIPLLGEFLKNAALSRFSRTLATLLGNGIPIASSIELVGRTSGNAVIEEGSLKARGLILDGENIPEALRKSGIFPPLVVQMASVGVDSGSLPELLDKTADFYEERVDDFVALLTSMMEPVLLGVLGVIVGVVVVALYLPIFKLSQAAFGKG